MSDTTEPVPKFHRSTFCGPGGCVEVAAPSPELFLVRDAKNLEADAPVLSFDRTEWDAFLAGVQAGQFTADSLMSRS